MHQSIKFIAFLLCVLNVAAMFKPGWSVSDSSQPIHIVKGRAVKTGNERFKSVASIALRVGGLIGSIVLFIDAVRRRYDEPKAMPIVLAGMGIVTLGITSIVYYLEWGNIPTKPPPAIADHFCEQCVAQTRPERIMEMMTSHRIITFRLIGSMRRCPTCGSVVKTLWLWLFVPLLPFCSYRVLLNDKASFGSATAKVRRLAAWMDWTQVSIRYFILAVVAGGVTLIVYL